MEKIKYMAKVKRYNPERKEVFGKIMK